MRDEEIKTIDDISCFLQAELRPTMELQGSKDVVYRWLESTLVRFRYLWLDKKQKGLVLRYVEHITGYSRQHVSKLVRAYVKTGYIRMKSRRRRQGFQSKYSREDIIALAEVDQAMDGMSGTKKKPYISTLPQGVYQDPIHPCRYWKALQTQAQWKTWLFACGLCSSR